MAKVDGYVQFTCDRCGKTDYAAEKSPTAQLYKTIHRVTATEVEQERLLCATCAIKYRTLVLSQDVAFTKFMAEDE